MIRGGLFAAGLCLALAGGAFARPPLLFVGQDLNAVRSYIYSRCCTPPDGVTTYIGFYDLLSPAAHFGGAGIDGEGQPAADADWGAGPINAVKAAGGFDAAYVAIGLDISESAHPGGLRQIVAGAHDDKIDQLTRLVAVIDRRIALRIGYEFDGAWNKGYEDRAAYIAAWRHIVDRLRMRGVRNIVYVWQGSASPIDDILDGGRREDIGSWYPGDAYVDWVGLSWFLPATARPSGTQTARPPTQVMLAEDLARFAQAHGKKLMIAESSPQGFDLANGKRRAIGPIWDGPSGAPIADVSPDQIWATWYAPFFAFLRGHARDLAAVAYIDADWDSQPMWGKPYPGGYWGDSRLEAAPSLARKWRAAFAALQAGDPGGAAVR